MKEYLKKKGEIIAVIIITIGLSVQLVFIFIPPFNDWSFELDSELFNHYGCFIGGFSGSLFTLVGAILVYLTFTLQKESIDQQQEKDARSQFDSTFFNLLRTQQEITTQISEKFCFLGEYRTKLSKQVSGRLFFRYATKELTRILLSAQQEKYLGIYSENEQEQNTLENAYEEAVNDYKVPGYEYILDNFKKELKLTFVNKIYDIKQKEWEKLHENNAEKRIVLAYNFFFNRYEPVIGFYFRHLYHILKYIKKEKERRLEIIKKEEKERRLGITKKEKERCLEIAKAKVKRDMNQYVDFLQAQMSSNELLLLYYNAFLFPKMRELLIEFPAMLENLTKSYLNDDLKKCNIGIKIKDRNQLLDIALGSFQ